MEQEPRPFVWTKTVYEILDTLAAYCRRITESPTQDTTMARVHMYCEIAFRERMRSSTGLEG
jgi:hypothetical protein